MVPVALFLIGNHRLYRAGIKALLERMEGVQVVGESGATVDDLRPLAEVHPAIDLLLLDVESTRDGSWQVRQVRHIFPDPPLLILSSPTEPSQVRHIMASGATGYLVKSATPEELMAAIQLVREGGVYLHPMVARMVFETALPEPETLTDREQSVLRQLTAGFSNDEIARHLHVSVSTVKAHLRSLFSKLAVSDRTHLVAEAIGRGLVEPPGSAEVERASRGKSGSG